MAEKERKMQKRSLGELAVERLDEDGLGVEVESPAFSATADIERWLENEIKENRLPLGDYRLIRNIKALRFSETRQVHKEEILDEKKPEDEVEEVQVQEIEVPVVPQSPELPTTTPQDTPQPSQPEAPKPLAHPGVSVLPESPVYDQKI